jgi:polyphenol oxidase
LPFIQAGELRYFVFNSFSSTHVSHGIFTRHGGVSSEPWASLNVGGNNGDERSNVIENRKRSFDSLNLPVDSLFDVWQVHSSEVICTDVPRPLDAPHRQADAIITNRRGISLFMRFGDCVPIFLFDPVNNVIALVHAGWPGTVNMIALRAVRTMEQRYNSVARDIIAGIGPSVGPDHYMIREDVISQVKSSLKEESKKVLFQRNGFTYFDLWTANALILMNAGLAKIEISSICTACNMEDWYSHRGENGKTGRFGAVFALR